MRRLLFFLLVFAFISPAFAGQEITNCRELQQIDEDLDGNYILANDIDCSSIGNFDPIGDYSPRASVENSFQGVFNGQGHTIKNLRIVRPEDSQIGLFSGLLEGSEVTDVRLKNVNIEGKHGVGGIVGRNDHGTIRRVSVEGEIKGQGNVGGVVGWNWGTIGQVFSSGTVEGKKSVGGLAGINFAATIVAGYSLADVKGDETVGGVVGRNLGVSSTVDKVFAAGNVEGDEKVGGALGHDNSYGASAYWNEETTGQERSARKNDWFTENGLTTEQMTGQDARENLGGYDWGNTWGVPEEGRYPYLKAIQDSGIKAPTNTEQNQASESSTDTQSEEYVEEDQGRDEVSEQDSGEDDETERGYDIQMSYGEQFENGVGPVRFTTNPAENNQPLPGKWKLYQGTSPEGQVLSSSSPGTINWNTLILREGYCEDGETRPENTCENTDEYMPIGPGIYTVKFEPETRHITKQMTFETTEREIIDREKISDSQESVEENSQEPPEKPGKNDIIIQTGQPGKGTETKLLISAKQDTADTGYIVIIKDPSGQKVHEKRDLSSPRKTVRFTPEKNGDYTVKMLPEAKGLVGKASKFVSKLVGGSIAQETFKVTDTNIAWKKYCQKKDYSTEKVDRSIQCLKNEVVSQCFNDHPEEKCTGEGGNVVAESVCQDLLNYKYEPETQKCVPQK